MFLDSLSLVTLRARVSFFDVVLLKMFSICKQTKTARIQLFLLLRRIIADLVPVMLSLLYDNTL